MEQSGNGLTDDGRCTASLRGSGREVEGAEHDVAKLVKGDVLWLEVALDETHEMEGLELRNDLGGVEASVFLWQALA